MSHCPSGKISHDNLVAARAHARVQARRLNQAHKLAESNYAYRCADCRKWHLTRRPEWNGEPNVLAHEASPEALQRWAMGEAS